MTAPAPDPHRAMADDLVTEWMKGCAEPVCAVQDELRLRAMITRALVRAGQGSAAA